MASNRNRTRKPATPDAPAEDAPTEEPTAEEATEPTEAPAEKKAKTPKWEPIEDDRAAWIAKHARPAVAPCLCGCGGTTKGRFAPGHDATLKAQLTETAANGTDAAKEAATAALVTFGW